MVEVINHMIEKLKDWELMLIILIVIFFVGSVVFFILINRIHIKLCGILEINSKE